MGELLKCLQENHVYFFKKSQTFNQTCLPTL